MKISSFCIQKFSQNGFLFLGILLSATVMTARSSLAQSTTVNFTGTVTTSCTLGTVTDGLLSLDSSGFVLSTAPINDGVAGSVFLTCNGGTTVEITNFSETSAPQAIASGLAIVKDPLGNEMVRASLNGTGTGTTIYPSGGGTFNNEEFTVEVTLDNSSTLIQSGTYQYAVTLNFVPQ
ncbi:MAG: hypothetical protein VKJ02_15710 [Snowella sp.]|nr:hypothetical protein [Snowella sp.]